MESPVFCSLEFISCILLAIKKAYIILSNDTDLFCRVWFKLKRVQRSLSTSTDPVVWGLTGVLNHCVYSIDRPMCHLW